MIASLYHSGSTFRSGEPLRASAAGAPGGMAAVSYGIMISWWNTDPSGRRHSLGKGRGQYLDDTIAAAFELIFRCRGLGLIGDDAYDGLVRPQHCRYRMVKLTGNVPTPVEAESTGINQLGEASENTYYCSNPPPRAVAVWATR